MIVQIKNIKDYMGRSDIKRLKWFKLDCDFMISQFVYGLSAEAIRLYIHIIGQCVANNDDKFDLNVDFFAHNAKTTVKNIENAINELSARNYLIRTDPNESVQTRTDPCLYIHTDIHTDIQEKKNTVAKSSDFSVDVIDTFNLVCKSKLSTVKTITDKRKKSILKARKEILKELQDWEDYFNSVVQSDFLTGKNNSGWKADFDWLIKVDNIAKVLEGKYGTRKTERERLEQEIDDLIAKEFSFEGLRRPEV